MRKHFYVFTVLLTVKLFVARWLISGDVNVGRFLLFELPFVLLLTSLLEMAFPVEGKTTAYLVADGITSVLLVASAAYVNYFGRMPTPDSLTLIGQLPTVHSSVTYVFRPAYLLFFADIPLVAVARRIRPVLDDAEPPRRPLKAVAWMTAVVAAGSVIYTTLRPIPDDLQAVRARGVVTQEVVTVVDRLRRSDERIDVADVAGLQTKIVGLKRATETPERDRPHFGEARGRNLILIQVESLQGLPVGCSVDGRPIVPVIDGLVREGYFFRNVYQQVSAGNTSDAEFMMNTSLYPLPTTAVAVSEGKRAFPSLPKLLKRAGYVTMTFHANDKSFWNRKELYPALGFDEVYDKAFFGSEDVVGIGASDEVLFRKALPVLAAEHREGKPFYAHLITLTPHHPFILAKDKQRLALPAELKGSLVGNYLQSMNYDDAGIGQFIEGLKREGLWEESVVVVVGDHFGLQIPSMSPAEVALASGVLGRPYTEPDRLNVPFVVAVPGVSKGEVVEQPGGQVDVLPTVAALLGVSLRGQVHFGQDLLSSSGNMVGIRYHSPLGTFADDRVFCIPKPGFEDGVLFDAHTRRSWTAAEPRGLADEFEHVMELEKLSDSYVKSLPLR